MNYHQEMGHLGAPRVVQLARERFYWPNMEADITHFVTCPCLKQQRPSLSTRAPLHLTFYIWKQVLVVLSIS